MDNRKIELIEHGMVFDHLTFATGGRVFDVLSKYAWIDGFYPIMVGSFPSKSKGRKDVAKLDGLHLAEGTGAMNEIALLSPEATVSWIDHGQVLRKKKAWECLAPLVTSRLIECPNANCITHEEAPPTFRVQQRQPLSLECVYCKRSFMR
ncbi:MAG: aspartate carbamoyltransferase regulatory subunit [Candidatus Aenigmarchaeota archaeon]|nr:aspartate carbamoyltransferase regulatory subunit [Candidatus Aenigmarchaeota archaeon]